MKYLIAGLGNIGAEYRDTRHNVGFMVVRKLAEKFDAQPEISRHAYTAQGKYKGRQIHMIFPTTYMNLSGKAVRYYLDKLGISMKQLLVVTDDIALPFGKLRLRAKGSDGGHNGLKNINEVLGSQQYPRLRFGVGSDFFRGQQVDYVLSPFTDEEMESLPLLIDKCVEGILSFTSIGINHTMTEFNKK